MSEASPFRTEDDREYRWPPEGVGPIERTYTRCTAFFGAGEPKPWMKPWVQKITCEWVADNLPAITAYFVHSSESPPEEFLLDQAWWTDVLLRGARQDERAVGNGKKPWKVASLHRMTPRAKFLMYLKALPDIKRDFAADRGTHVHKLAEDITRGFEVNVPQELIPYVDNHIRFLEAFNPRFLEIESVVYSDKYGYAGQFDGLVEIDGKVTMIDYKTGVKGIKGSIAPQFALYSNADFIGREDGTKDPMPKIEQFFGVSIREDGYDVVPVRVDDEILELALAFSVAGKWDDAFQKTVLGKPVVR